MARDLKDLDYSGLSLGGLDGGIYAAGATAVEDVACHVIELMEDAGTFSVLAAVNQAGTVVNMLTANAYTGVSFGIGTLIYAPFGGNITDFTCDKATRRFTIPTSNRTKQ